MDVGRWRREGERGEGSSLFFSVGIFISVGEPVQRKASFDERYKKSENRYKEKSQVQRKSQANPPRDNKVLSIYLSIYDKWHVFLFKNIEFL